MEGNRYDRNLGTITKEEQALLKEKSVCIIGCGGLGGGVIEGLTRLGVGRLTIVDGDVFDVTNLNRQVLSHEENIGTPKVEEGARQMKQINSEVEICPLHIMVDERNVQKIIHGHDAVVDALDNVQARMVLEDACEAEEIPLIHGAIGGWNGQVAVVMPGDRLLHAIYRGDVEESSDDTAVGKRPIIGNPPFTPAIVAGMEVAETLKVLLGRDEALKGKLLMMDLLYHQYETIEFS